MVKKTKLICGLTVISEELSEIPSIALSYTLKSGSRAESAEKCGLHHLLEHLLFKGSRAYDQKKIADVSDRLGGRLNAFTGKEITQFYIKSIDEKFGEAFQLLTDIVLNPTFPETEFEKEKNVIIQEIKESADNPDTHAFETFYERMYRKNGLGYPISGREETVVRLDRGRVLTTYTKLYRPQNLVLSAAGSIRHRDLVNLAERAFSRFPARKPARFSFAPVAWTLCRFAKTNSTLNQLYVIIGFDSISAVSPLRYRMMIMNDILGAGMSSRLYQSIREEKGLAYTVSSFTDTYLECGLLLIYAIVEPGNVGRYHAAVKKEIGILQKKGITAEELDRAKDHIKSSVILSLENNVSKMRFNTNQELYFGRELTLQEILAKINAVTIPDINALLLRLLPIDRSAHFIYGGAAASGVPSW